MPNVGSISGWIGAAALLVATGIAAGVASGAAAQDAATPEATPEIGQTRTILFGFDHTPFDAEGIETVSSVARRFRLNGAGAIEVDGHADTVGDPDFNFDLSRRRAGFTRDELVARGVPAASIAILPYGETRPAVETGDEVRSRANRRVQVTILAEGVFPPPDETRPIAMKLPPPPAITD